MKENQEGVAHQIRERKRHSKYRSEILSIKAIWKTSA